MTLITFKDGKVVMPDLRHKIGTQQECCECAMPSSVTLALSGSPQIYFYGANLPAGFIIIFNDEFDGCDSPPALYSRVYGQQVAYENSNWPGYGRTLQPDAEVVLDLVEAWCGHWKYDGLMPEGPSILSDYPNVTCGGDLTQLVSISIDIVPSPVSVSFSPPTKNQDSLERATGTVETQSGSVAQVSLADGGSGYAVVPTVRQSPTITVSIASEGGIGAELTATLEEYSDTYGGQLWRIASVSVAAPGSGYADGDQAVVGCANTSECYEYYGASLTATIEDGEVVSVSVGDGGGYYGEGPGAPDVDDVQVLIGSRLGQGAAAEAVVDSDPDSPTFGEIVAVNVTSPGSGYENQRRYLITISLPTLTMNDGGELFMAGFQHTQVLIGDEQLADSPTSDSINPAECYLGQLSSVSPRLSFRTCPIDLLNKAYGMKVVAKYGATYQAGNPNYVAPANACDLYYEDIGSQTHISGVTVTLST